MMGYQLVDIYDNVVEDHVAELIHSQIKGCEWKFDYHSNNQTEATVKTPNKHWHIFCGHDVESITENGYDWLLPIWESAKRKYDFEEKYKIENFKRLYMNAHTHGIEPHIHRDDGDFTMIYYPRIDWDKEWGGGTVVWDENYDVEQHVAYKGNRLMVFPAHCLHSAQPVHKWCMELRTCVVFKTYVEGSNVDRLDFYKD